MDFTIEESRKRLEHLKQKYPDVDVEGLARAMSKWGGHTICPPIDEE